MIAATTLLLFINESGTSLRAWGWRTSSSCPPFHPSSQADSAHLLWSPPGCHGIGWASLEPKENNQAMKHRCLLIKLEEDVKRGLTSFGATGRCVLLSSSLSTNMYLQGRQSYDGWRSEASFVHSGNHNSVTHFSRMLSFSFWSATEEMLFPWFTWAQRMPWKQTAQTNKAGKGTKELR